MRMTEAKEQAKASQTALSTETNASTVKDPIPAGTYLTNILNPLIEEALENGVASKYMAELVEAMNPRDPLERMLVEQLVYCHHRAASLQAWAMRQTKPEHSQRLNELADKAMNTYRRSMLGLADYRAPRRQAQYIRAQQFNQAESQQVALVEKKNPQRKRKKVTIKQGANRGDESPNRGESAEP
jgi:hypothetical protein